MILWLKFLSDTIPDILAKEIKKLLVDIPVFWSNNFKILTTHFLFAGYGCYLVLSTDKAWNNHSWIFYFTPCFQ